MTIEIIDDQIKLYINEGVPGIYGQPIIEASSGAIEIDWGLAQHHKQTEPTGSIVYTFNPPAGPCHLQLLMDSDGTSTPQTIIWPADVVWLGSVWAAASGKKALIQFWYDGDHYFASGVNQA